MSQRRQGPLAAGYRGTISPVELKLQGQHRSLGGIGQGHPCLAFPDGVGKDRELRPRYGGGHTDVGQLIAS